MTEPSSIAENLQQISTRLAAAAVAAQRNPSQVRLVAVSKTKPVTQIEQALDAGQRVFGENRVQEAGDKWPALKAVWPDVRLHLIGPLQTNKIKHVLGLFDVIETVDRRKLADALADAMTKTGHRPDCLVQVNTGEEPQKAGIAPAEADEFLAHCRDVLRLPIKGLMCIPPQQEPAAPHFALLREIARRNGLAELSMGMSDDFETAIRFGSTQVRLGTAIFGARERNR